MTTLLLCLLVLGLAPALDRLLRGRRSLQAFTDGLVQVSIVGLVLFFVLPEGLAAAGPLALGGLVMGLMVGEGVHRVPTPAGSAGAVVVVALLLHALIDGAGLGTDTHPGHALSEAIVLHNLPVGLAVWRVARRRVGAGGAAALLAATGLATAVGWMATAPVSTVISEPELRAAQCVFAGALLHPILHLGRRDGGVAGGLGALAGVLALIAMGASHAHEAAPGEGALSAGAAFSALAALAAPGLLLGSVASGWVPRSWRAHPAARMVTPGAGLITLGLALATLGPLLTALLSGGSLLIILALGRLPALSSDPPAAQPRRALIEVVFLKAGSWAAAGLGVAAFMEALLPERLPEALTGPGGVVMVTALALPVTLGPAALPPVAAVLLHKGLSTGAALALLLAAPWAGLSSWSVVSGRQGRARALAVTGLVLVVALGGGLGVDAIGLAAAVELHQRPTGWLWGLGLGLLGLAAALSLVRSGPHGVVETLLHPLDEAWGHDDDHPPCGGHDHGHDHAVEPNASAKAEASPR